MEIANIRSGIFAGKNRYLGFRKIDNFRDLGGYAAADGRTVRWGVLYRSGSLHKPTSSDQKRLATLNLQLIVDFRAEHELERRPDQLPAGARYVHIPMEDSSTKVWHEAAGDMVKNLARLDPAEYMRATNTELVANFTPGYAQFFREVLNSNGEPLLFHCAAGKDRTGFAAAVLLSLLGVPRDVVMQDYLLTNKYLLQKHSWNLFTARLFKGKKFSDGIRGFIKADEYYISAAFERIAQDFGSFDTYVRTGLGLSEKDIDHLRNMYLE